MFRYSLRRLHFRLRNVGVAGIEHPVRSFGWKFLEAIGLSNSNGTLFHSVLQLLLRRREAEVYSFFYTTVPTFIGHFINQLVGVMTS